MGCYVLYADLHINQNLQDIHHMFNSYVICFKYALAAAPSSNFNVVIDASKSPLGEHSGCFNLPTCNEITVLLHGNQYNHRDIVLKRRDNTLHSICKTHRSYDALQYPLLFVRGEDSYQFGIHQHKSDNLDCVTNKTVSCMNFYFYHFMVCDNSFNHMHCSGELFHQFVVDVCAKMESERLCFIQTHQKQLCSNSHIYLRDALINYPAPDSVGRLCILPSSFTRSPWYLHERTQDAMTYVRHYGRPDVFITFTCNPTWKEIKAELFPGQHAKDHHELLA
ncbi:uncharacterized protein LOC106879442 [Octopus bimaculoides]|uniref:uncharacterized protein LOC106879442 n=1 Tax=Octopus bimaculoides TaxID=37653 RepID=UPI00071CBB2E|nr:uncharacterized protein LOC106879442 [Octopus bimaculoides]|eukprot:XP_014784481.1 PREDICTED: uncharacterized protein LOC106879442 [Octopus bimaculoides]